MCDGLFEFGEFYFALQIKERSSEKGQKSEDSWMEEVVYGEAVKQMKDTIFALQNQPIIVSDLRHSKVNLNKSYTIIPIIVFLNEEITQYKRFATVGEKVVNIFSLADFLSMLNIIIHPYDIIDYLSLRHKWLLGANGLPTFAIGDSENKVDGHYTHTVEIIYNLVGAIDLPDFGD